MDGPSDPLRDWGHALILLGSVILVFDVAFALFQVVSAEAGRETYLFLDLAVPALALSAVLLGVGAVLRHVWTLSRKRKPDDTVK